MWGWVGGVGADVPGWERREGAGVGLGEGKVGWWEVEVRVLEGGGMGWMRLDFRVGWRMMMMMMKEWEWPSGYTKERKARCGIEYFEIKCDLGVTVKTAQAHDALPRLLPFDCGRPLLARLGDSDSGLGGMENLVLQRAQEKGLFSGGSILEE